jgi:hypothetical protein
MVSYLRGQNPRKEGARFFDEVNAPSIKTKGQFCDMVKTRSGVSEDQAKRDVDAWMLGKQF